MEEEELRNLNIDPGQIEIIDENLYNGDGVPVRIRVVAMDCPPTGGTPPPPVVDVVETNNPPPWVATIINGLHKEYAQPHAGRLRIGGEHGEITIQPREGTSLPHELRGAAPECLVQSATLEPLDGTGHRFEATLGAAAHAVPGRVLLMFLPDDPTG